MDNPLDLRRLRYLRAAIVEGSLTSAAAQLGISQPALSASIKSLEQDVGVLLLERHRFGVHATQYAAALLAHTHGIEAELKAAWDRVARLRGSEALELRIGCGPSEATRLLPRALIHLRHARPELRIFVEYGLNEVLMPMVRRGDVACALSSIPVNTAHPELQHQPLHVDRAVVVARVGHPLSTRRSVSIADLFSYPWVLARQWELERKALDDLFAQAGARPIVPEIETTSAILMKTIVMQSDFLTFVPHEMIHWEEQANLLRPLKAFASGWERHVGLTTRRGEAHGEALQALVASLRASLHADLRMYQSAAPPAR